MNQVNAANLLLEADQKQPAKTRSEHEARERLSFLQETLPFRWTSAVRVVLSGLQDRSGDGRNARSVIHMQFLEEFSSGRLRRDKGDLLCKTSTGELWDTSQADRMDCPTCPRCLAGAEIIIAKTPKSMQFPS